MGKRKPTETANQSQDSPCLPCKFRCGKTYTSKRRLDKHETWECEYNDYAVIRSAGEKSNPEIKKQAVTEEEKKNYHTLYTDPVLAKHLGRVGNIYSRFILAQTVKCIVPGFYPLLFVRSDSNIVNAIGDICTIKKLPTTKEINRRF